jgi:replication-associated recombination protein RarA
VLGQDKIVNRLLALRRRGLAGRAYWLSGQSGTGKTTIARLIAAEVAEEFCVQEVDAAGLTVAALRELTRRAASPVATVACAATTSACGRPDW